MLTKGRRTGFSSCIQILAATANLLSGGLCIRLEAVVVPQFKFRGDNATLLCKYELEPNEELFSLKWYKEETEFYRFTPPEPRYDNTYSGYYYNDDNGSYNRGKYNNVGNYRRRKRAAGGAGEGARLAAYHDQFDGGSRRQDVSWYPTSRENEEGGEGVVSDDGGYGRRNRGPSGGRRREGGGRRRGGKGRRNKQHRQQSGGRGIQSEPGLPGTVLTWPVDGININTESSVPQRVELEDVDFATTGKFRCEVTVKVHSSALPRGPHHDGGRGRGSRTRMPPPPPPLGDGGDVQAIDMRELVKRLTVVELPSHRPRITGGELEREYRAGDLLNLTCVSEPSNPVSQLQWRLNGKEVEAEFVSNHYQNGGEPGLVSTITTLLLPLEPSHFEESSDGRIRVKCLGRIEAEFWETDSVENEYPGEKSVKVLNVMESQWPASAHIASPSRLLLLLIPLLTWAPSQRFHTFESSLT